MSDHIEHTCRYCGSYLHYESDCTSKEAREAQEDKQPGCTTCESTTHDAAHCPYYPTARNPETVEEGRPKGIKHDTGKPRYDLLPFKALAGLVDVITLGAQKYSPNNWRALENPRERYLAALLRHAVKWASGERIDPDSGKPHMAHIATNAMFLLELEEEGKL